ncbi:hypothetical protein SteCoe_4099 [Stentor coeruleus]|uniref:Uncharacterized protein n=1 Tax=Stentor coeruleus TaxID=5963 RepID=A0A1R2CVI5_9CILI|nr:hypothetical protein SteCoe_4099 [Stentor coeruleus]
MKSEVYANSIQLDQIIVDKLKNSSRNNEALSMTNAELTNELNSLKYLLYVINQDRLVIHIQALRQELFKVSSRVQSFSDKDSMQKYDIKDIEELSYQLGLYEATGKSSEICTVVNTSILPYSYENTEREFSPFSASPLTSPRLPMETVPTAFLTTEATANRIRNKPEKPPMIPSEVSEDSLSHSSQSNNPNDCSNYLMQHNGDDDDYPSNSTSRCHSRQSSITYENLN